MRWDIAESHSTAAAQAQTASVGRSVVGVNAIVSIPKSFEFWGPPGGRTNLRIGSASVMGGVPIMCVAVAVAVPKCHESVLLDSSCLTGPHRGGTRGCNETRGLIMAGVTPGAAIADTGVAYLKFAAGGAVYSQSDSLGQ